MYQIGVFKILSSIKNIFVHIRSLLKFIFLIIVAGILITSIVSCFYKITYSVTLDGEFIGYTNKRAELQERFNEYMEQTENQNIAFVEIKSLPEYSLCLVKKEYVTNDEEIFAKVTGLGTAYYEYYTIMEGTEEKYYVSTLEQAQEIITQLTTKKSSNISKISYKKIFGTTMQEFTDSETIIAGLYKKPVTRTTSGSYTIASASTKVDLGITLIKPVTSGYTISSRYGSRSSGTHTGLDIAAPTGTTITAAAGGTVTYVNYSNVSYGNCIKISHGNGVETLYAHCSQLYVSTGETVAQGQTIAAVGSTGNSTGPHLHFEVRVNGQTINPQHYVY